MKFKIFTFPLKLPHLRESERIYFREQMYLYLIFVGDADQSIFSLIQDLRIK